MCLHVQPFHTDAGVVRAAALRQRDRKPLEEGNDEDDGEDGLKDPPDARAAAEDGQTEARQPLIQRVEQSAEKAAHGPGEGSGG